MGCIHVLLVPVQFSELTKSIPFILSLKVESK